MKKETQIAIEQSKIAQLFQKHMNIANYDVEPIYVPNLQSIIGLLKIATIAVPTDKDGWFASMHKGLFTKSPKTRDAFLDMLSFLQESLTTRSHRYTFWHSAALVLLTSYLYALCLNQNKHQSINLADEKTLKAMEWDACVLIINHLSNRIYQTPLTSLHQIVSLDMFDISVFFEFFKRQINLCNAK